jgi:C4-type Zn-finger protein
MKTTTGNYSLDGIKYFDAFVELEYTCPNCGQSETLDLSDGVIEYPKPVHIVHLDCDCGYDIRLELNIELTVTINYKILE